ncbi:MAG: siderophore biosynthesis protein, partial [Pseudomonadota bacterium]|nr:siderophore biosynthesis protein [Pseudomonadota bacterium]
SHQQPRLRLLLKDNDAGRLLAEQLGECCPALIDSINALQDRRILVDGPLPLAQMFTTITLQLNIAVLVEGLANLAGCDRNGLYGFVRSQIETLLTEFEVQGEDVSLARHVLLKDEQLYLKYLLRAASLENKETTGATDVNKFYGKSAPNMLLKSSLAR